MSNDKKPYFPLFVDLNEKQIVVVGAGTIAKRRIRTLVSFTNHLTVIAPEVNRELLDMEKAGMLRIKRKNYEREDIYDADYVMLPQTTIRSIQTSTVHANAWGSP